MISRYHKDWTKISAILRDRIKYPLKDHPSEYEQLKDITEILNDGNHQSAQDKK